MTIKKIPIEKTDRYKKARKAAKKYEKRGHFQIYDNNHYTWAWRNKVLDKICMHMKDKHAPFVWTEAKLKKEAKKYKSRGDFQANSRAAYQSAYIRGLLDKVCPHMNKPNTWIVKDIDYEKIKSLSLEYQTWSDFIVENMGAYGALRRHGRFFELKEYYKDYHGDTSQR